MCEDSICDCGEIHSVCFCLFLKRFKEGHSEKLQNQSESSLFYTIVWGIAESWETGGCGRTATEMCEDPLALSKTWRKQTSLSRNHTKWEIQVTCFLKSSIYHSWHFLRNAMLNMYAPEFTNIQCGWVYEYACAHSLCTFIQHSTCIHIGTAHAYAVQTVTMLLPSLPA